MKKTFIIIQNYPSKMVSETSLQRSLSIMNCVGINMESVRWDSANTVKRYIESENSSILLTDLMLLQCVAA